MRLKIANKHELRLILLNETESKGNATKALMQHSVRPTEQMEDPSVMPPVEGQELLQGAVLLVQSPVLLPSASCASPTQRLAEC